MKKKRISKRHDNGVTPLDTTARIEKPTIPLNPIKRKYDYENKILPEFVKDERTLLQRKSSEALRAQRHEMDNLHSLQHIWGGFGGPVSRADAPLRYNKEKGNVLAASEALVGEMAIGLGNRVVDGLRGLRGISGKGKAVSKAEIAYEPIDVGVVRRIDPQAQRDWINNWNKERLPQFEAIAAETSSKDATKQQIRFNAKRMINSARNSVNRTPVYDMENVLDRNNFYNYFAKNINYFDDFAATRGVNTQERFYDLVTTLEASGARGANYHNFITGKGASPILKSGNNSTVLHEVTHAQQLHDVNNKASRIVKDAGHMLDGYADDGPEVYARLNQQRKDLFDLGLIDPSKKITINDIKVFKDATKGFPDRGILSRYPDETLLELFNKIPITAGTVGVGATALGAQEYNEGKTPNMKKNKIKKSLPKYNPGMTPLGLAPLGKSPAGLSQTKITNIGSNTGTPNITGGASSGGGIGGMANIGSAAVGALSSQMDVWGGADIESTPEVTMAKGPIQYQKTGYINKAAELKNLKSKNTSSTLGAAGSGAALGATVGSIAGPIGTVIGGAAGAIIGGVTGIFGGAKKKRQLKRKIARENERITRENQFNLSESHSGMLQQEYAREFGDTESEALYNKGKSKCDAGKSANALVGNGETIVDGNTGELEEVTQGRGVGIDDVQANIQPQDAIAGNLTNPRTGNTFAEDMKPLTRMEKKLRRNMDRNTQAIAQNTEKLVTAYTRPMSQQILADQAAVHYNKGKSSTPKYDIGRVATAVGGVTEGFAALAPSIYNIIQGRKAAETVSPDQLYSPNARAQQALNLMAGRRYNVKPEMEALRGLERRQRYSARQTGSESGIGRAMDVAGGLNMQRAIGDLYGRKQMADIGYRGEEASMMGQLGAQEASDRSRAMASAYDINARGRAAKKAYTAAGLTGISEYSQMQRKLRNQQSMDDMRMRGLNEFLRLQTTGAKSDYLTGWGG